MTGTLEAINSTTGESAVYPWSANVDLDTFQMTSNKTLAFEPGIYTFNMILEKEGRQYAGSTQYEIQDSDQVEIPFAINPIIGDREIDVEVVKELPRFKFRYDVDELNVTATAPRLGVIVDGGNEELFTINPTTGMTETWLAMEEGNHSVGLRYYDGNVLKGKSLTSQESITVVPGEPFNMDLAALHGEAVFALGELGGEGNVTVNVPSIVIEEAGALSELRTLLTYSDNNGTVIEREVSLYPSGSDYQGSVILNAIQYGTATYQLQFFDTGEATDEYLGSCVTDEVNLSATGGTSLCNLELIRRAVNSGNLVATVGVNVLTSEMEPVAGANVYVDGAFKGITGSGTFGTSGYLKLYTIAGEKTFTAEENSSNMSGSTTETLKVLGVHNVDITVGETTPTPPDSNVTGGAFRTVTYTGNGVGTGDFQDVYVGFEPGLVWVKNRTAWTQNVMVDQARGLNNELLPSSNNMETTNLVGITSFNEDGFSVGYEGSVNGRGNQIVAWCWALPSEKNATAEWGGSFDISPHKELYGETLSIVTYFGTRTAGDILPHSLGAVPEMMIFKHREDDDAWTIYHKDVGSGVKLEFSDAGSVEDNVYLNDTDPTATGITLGNGKNSNSSGEMVVYLFTSVEGKSKVGSYIGEGQDMNLSLGFEPDFFMVKRTDASGVWSIIDSRRGITEERDPRLVPSATYSEDNPYVADPIPDGLTINATNGDWNIAGGHYIYLALKEHNASL